jgi:signal transduction histidine kinase
MAEKLAIKKCRLYGPSRHAVAWRDECISAVSHELRTPVTSLNVYTEVLQLQAESRGDHSSAQLNP